MNSAWQAVFELTVIAVLILGIWRFRTPAGARFGNLCAAAALLAAGLLVWYRHPVREPATVVLALLVGGGVGTLVAMRVTMLQIPAMVAFQHGAGGIAAFLTALAELTRTRADLVMAEQLSGVLGILIGATTFSGSMVASGKLSGLMKQTPVVLPQHGPILAMTLSAIVVVGGLAAAASGPLLLAAALVLVALSVVLGIVFAIRIGGADMPVLISFLNATAGLAAAFCGVMIENRLLIAGGATVAASGSILTHVMCQAMNRKLSKVLLGADLKPTSPLPRQPSPAAVVPPEAISAEPLAAAESSPPAPLARAVAALEQAQSVIIIPGYGMALAHAQHEVADLALALQQRGKQVRFAIHPIAGRMPGHMHVLLAEADVDSDLLFDLREINADFAATDLVVIVGACDVVNPAAIHVEGTPISGMPILAAHEAKQVLVCNVDARPGYSGVENPLYQDAKTILMLGDAKATLGELLGALG